MRGRAGQCGEFLGWGVLHHSGQCHACAEWQRHGHGQEQGQWSSSETPHAVRYEAVVCIAAISEWLLPRFSKQALVAGYPPDKNLPL
jgi:hypothetical protein